jgi:hypothetical protein
VSIILAPSPLFQFSYQGQPLIGGKLFTYLAGTTTKQVTYTNSSGSVPCSNPIILDSNGVAQYWLDNSLSYKFVVALPTDTDPPTSPLYTTDNVAAVQLTPYYSQTTVEQLLGITPTNFSYQEGDIRRYGATTGSTDNSPYFNSALSVSGAGGSHAYIPAGTWTIANAVTVAAGSSMIGNASKYSVIYCTNCNGLQFGASNSYSLTTAPNCVFRDFVIIGSNSATSTYTGIYSNIVAGSGAIYGVRFENIGIVSFQIGFQLRGFNAPTKCDGVFIYNVAQGFYFLGQSIGVTLEACEVVRGTMTPTGGAGTAIGISFNVTAGETAQAIHIHACNVYNFDTNISVPVGGFEVQIEHCDISYANNIGVVLYAVNGGVWLRDCWIELKGGVTGTIGVQIPSEAVNSFNKIHVCNNNIVCDNPFAGSIGVSLGYNNAGVLITGNFISGFDQGVAAIVSVSGNGGAIIRDNTIDILTSVYSSSSFAVQLNSSSIDVTVGPNFIVQGVGGASSPTSTWYSSATAASTSSITVTAASSFPAGTWVQFDTTAFGLSAGPYYYVLTSSGTTITVGAYSGASAISTTGSYAGNVFAVPLPLTFNSGTAPGTAFYGRGSFIGTLSDPAVSGVFSFAASGKAIALSPPSGLSGSAGSTAMAITGLLPFLAPAAQKNAVCGIENNTAYSYGMMTISTAAAMNVYINAGSAAFTNSGTKALMPNDIVYSYP